MALFALLYLLFALVILAATIIVTGLGLWRMAKNAGVPCAWAAFLPVGSGYITGMLADRSRYFYTGRAPRLGLAFWLPVLQALAIVGGLGMFGTTLTGFFALSSVLFFCCLSWGAIGWVVLNLYAVYYVFKDYAPDNAVLFTVLGTLFNIHWVFFLVERNTVPVSVRRFGGFPNGQPFYQGPDYRQGPNQGPEL